VTRILRALFRHRHRYQYLMPGAVIDPLTGGIFPLSRLMCICGEEDPYGVRLTKLIRMERI
jgi:hypothetical protein